MDTPYKTVLGDVTIEVTSDLGWRFGCGRMPHTDPKIERSFVMVTVKGENPRAVYYGSFPLCLSTKDFLVRMMKSSSK